MIQGKVIHIKNTFSLIFEKTIYLSIIPKNFRSIASLVRLGEPFEVSTLLLKIGNFCVEEYTYNVAECRKALLLGGFFGVRARFV